METNNLLFNEDYIEFCAIVGMIPDHHDEKIFLAGMTFQSLRDNQTEHQEDV